MITSDEAKRLGVMLRDAEDGNLLVGSFAAEMAGESYPFSKAMSKIMFDMYDDETLGQKFATWCDKNEK